MIDFEELITAVRRSGVLVDPVTPPRDDSLDRPSRPFAPPTALPWPLQRLARGQRGPGNWHILLLRYPRCSRISVPRSHTSMGLGTSPRTSGAMVPGRSVAVRVPGKDVVARTRTGYLAPQDVLR